MLLSIVSILIILVCLAAIFFVVSKHADILSAIDVDALPSKKESEVKNKIVKERIERKLSSFKSFLSLLAEPSKAILRRVSQPVRNGYHTLLDVREAHKRNGIASIDAAALSGEALQIKIQSILDEVDILLRNERTSEAEKKLIDVISLDPKEVRAYRGLAEIYMEQKEWHQAKDVLKYACRLLGDRLARAGGEAAGEATQRLTYALYDLAMVYNSLAMDNKALECLKQAQEIDSKNPKILDAILSQYILMGQRLKAERALQQLKDANIENQKVEEFESKIRQLSY